MTIAVFVQKSKYISIIEGISKLVDKHNDREEGERDRETHSPGLTTANGWESTNSILQLSNLISNIGTSQFLILFTVFWRGINAWYKQKCLQHLDAHHLVCLVIQIGVLVTQQLCVVLVFIRSSANEYHKIVLYACQYLNILYTYASTHRSTSCNRLASSSCDQTTSLSGVLRPNRLHTSDLASSCYREGERGGNRIGWYTPGSWYTHILDHGIATELLEYLTILLHTAAIPIEMIVLKESSECNTGLTILEMAPLVLHHLLPVVIGPRRAVLTKMLLNSSVPGIGNILGHIVMVAYFPPDLFHFT